MGFRMKQRGGPRLPTHWLRSGHCACSRESACRCRDAPSRPGPHPVTCRSTAASSPGTRHRRSPGWAGSPPPTSSSRPCVRRPGIQRCARGLCRWHWTRRRLPPAGACHRCGAGLVAPASTPDTPRAVRCCDRRPDRRIAGRSRCPGPLQPGRGPIGRLVRPNADWCTRMAASHRRPRRRHSR